MMLPEIIKNKITEILASRFNKEVRIFDSQVILGGDINSAVKLCSSEGNYFIKWNDAIKFPEMFCKEANGLSLLARANYLRIPSVVSTGSAGKYSFLILEFLESGSISSNFWHQFGEALSNMHKSSDKIFGLDHDNYIGSLVQSNKQHQDWISFFIEERIQVQLKLAFDSKLINEAILHAAERLFGLLNGIMPKEAPALLHGDLWSGNYMVDALGNPCLIDPAVYYGHREMDLAMTKLFGGFNSEFYEAYHQNFKLEEGWENRMDIYNLYPLLVHVNLFGGHYVSQVASILNFF